MQQKIVLEKGYLVAEVISQIRVCRNGCSVAGRVVVVANKGGFFEFHDAIWEVDAVK